MGYINKDINSATKDQDCAIWNMVSTKFPYTKSPVKRGNKYIIRMTSLKDSRILRKPI